MEDDNITEFMSQMGIRLTFTVVIMPFRQWEKRNWR